MINDTIVALSTAPITSAIGVIRMSGDKSLAIIKELIHKDIPSFKNRVSIVSKLFDKDNNVVDEVVILLYRGPNSFTGEDVVEINCHGGLITINKIISLCIGLGARMAEHGEFSKKAFYNNKIDLIQAESINDLIVSKSELSTKLALSGLGGNTSDKLKEIKEKLVKMLAQIDVNIDYPEYEDIEQLTNESIKPILDNLYIESEKLIEKSNKGKLIRDGIKTAIIGKPNAGKSSLLNCLLGEEKAIVTNIAGTTRDVVEGHILINGVPFELLDTAGIREAHDQIEQIGIQKSKEAIEKADLVILVIDGSQSIKEQSNDLEEFKQLSNQALIVVINKMDDSKESIDGIKISAKNNDIKELTNKMIEIVGLGNFEYNDLAILSNTRQIGLMTKAFNNIKDSIDAINNHVDIDLVSIDIQHALDSINEILGDKTNIDIDNEIFAHFCIGK